MNKSPRILLLGGGGFIGRAVAVHLRERGNEVHAIMRSNRSDMPDGISVHAGGMENIPLLRNLLPRMDAVIHLASATTPGISRDAPALEARLNLAPTLAFVEELQRHPSSRLVFLSSGGTIYGNPGSANTPESAPPQPLSYYGAGKLAIEEFLRCFARITGTPVTILRPSNVYGQGQPLYQGFAVIRTMLQHALDGTSMSIWGDGSVVRDFIHVDDVVAAVECILSNRTSAGTYNVGAGQGHSLNELAEIVSRIAGQPLHVKYEPARAIDVQRIVLDASSMQDHFEWKPRIALEDGIAAMWRWLKASSATA